MYRSVTFGYLYYILCLIMFYYEGLRSSRFDRQHEEIERDIPVWAPALISEPTIKQTATSNIYIYIYIYI